MRGTWYALAVISLWMSPGWAAESAELEEATFGEQMRTLKAEPRGEEKLRRARDMVRMHRFSSLQVKAIAAGLSDDTARLEFATAAYPRTIDPENFYEVYDAFTAFSKVMRLHDRVRQFERVTVPPAEIPATVRDQEFKDILRALKRESFDQTRTRMARQILSDSRRLFLAAQIKEMLECFDFEPNKVEVAKYAYDYTYDREKYFLVNEALSFEASKQELSRYIQSRHERPGPSPRR